MFDVPVVGSREELEVVLSDLRRVLNLTVRLPNSPFLIFEGTDSFCEFEEFKAGTFGTFLEALTLQFQDEYVSGARLEPDYLLNDQDLRGNFSAFHIPSSRVADQYWQALTYEPDSNPADAIFSYSNVLAAAGSSGRWAIWGERMVGIAIVRTVGSDISWREDADWFLSPNEAIRAFIEPNFNIEPLPEEFRQLFLRNVLPASDAGISPN